MTLTLTLLPETEAHLRRRAAEAGLSVEAYALDLVEQAVTPGRPAALLRAMACAPQVPGEWVDELEQLIRQGERPASYEDPFAEGR